MELNIDNALSLEEEFVYLTSIGKSMSDAYRAIVPCAGLSNALISSRAWKYSKRPAVLSIASMDYDSMYATFAGKKLAVLNNLHYLSLNAKSEFVQQSSSTAFLNAIAKATKLDINLNHSSNELTEALDELRQLALSPHRVPHKGNNAKCNNFQDSQNVLNLDGTWSKEIEVKEKMYDDITLDGEVVDVEVFKEQTEGINPSCSNKVVMGNNDGKTGAFRDPVDGRFVSNDKVAEMFASDGL